MTTPPPAEAPESADRTPPASDASSAEWAAWLSRYPQLVLRSPADTTPDVVKDAMAFYEIVLRRREAERVATEAYDLMRAATDAYEAAVERRHEAEAELRRAMRGDA